MREDASVALSTSNQFPFGQIARSDVFGINLETEEYLQPPMTSSYETGSDIAIVFSFGFNSRLSRTRSGDRDNVGATVERLGDGAGYSLR